MIPLIYPDMAKLISLRFEAVSSETSKLAERMSGLPVVVEDGAFTSWWKPTWCERLNLLCGAHVRVRVNYSLHGLLYLDTESAWGTESADWSPDTGGK